MKVQEYLDKLPTGGVVDNLRVLAAMKRKGLITDYSQWGYLEPVTIWYIRHTDSMTGVKVSDTYRTYFGRIPTDGEKGTCVKPYGTMDELFDHVPLFGFFYKGSYFTEKYFDGCFRPYLVKTNPPMKVAS